MNIDLSEKELTLLEDVLFPHILQKHAEVFKATGQKKIQLSNYINDLEDLNHKIWKMKEGII